MSLVVVAVVAADGGTVTLVVVSIASLLLIGVAANFSRLTVEVDDEAVIASFGRGWPVTRVARERIAIARSVRNRWYHGWGLRKVRHGWMYNVSGFDAVELERHDGGVFRIGTDEPELLLAAVRSLIGR